jgi:Fe-S cluster assembly protein SufD
MSTAFTTDALTALGGPDWLVARRAAASERAAALSLPSSEEEVWRYSRIDELDLDRFAPAAAVAQLEHGDLGRARVGPASQLDGAAELLDDLADPTSAIGWLRRSLAVDPIVIDVPDGVRVAAPIVIRHQGPADGEAVASQVVVRAGADSEVVVIELAEGGGAGLALPGSNISVGAAARVGYLAVQDLSASTWALGALDVAVESQAAAAVAQAGFGGDYARLRTDCHLVGRGATGDLLAAYFGSGAQTLDYRTFQEHVAPDTTSNLLFKGAVGDQARSVYTGLIRVAKDARGTNAFQTNRNIKLSEDAWAESVPNLVIENNDVHCSHASAVGPIDEEQRFYLESRGIPTGVADRLIVGGFFDEVVAGFPGPELHPRLRASVAAKVAAVLA